MMRALPALLACASALLPATAAAAEWPKIVAENSDPSLSSYADACVAVCEEWFPKISEILYGPGHRSPYSEVLIRFDADKVAGRARLNVIHLQVKRLREPHELDYRAVVVHELAHVVQDYTLRLGSCGGLHAVPCFFKIRFAQQPPVWLQEGIADYVTYAFYTRTNRPFLRLTRDGQLTGYTDSIPYLYGLQRGRIAPNAAFRPRHVHAGKGYQHGYTVASAFLQWLVETRDKEVVHKLNAAIRERRYHDDLFQRYCGAPLDRLWAEFLRQPLGAADTGTH